MLLVYYYQTCALWTISKRKISYFYYLGSGVIKGEGRVACLNQLPESSFIGHRWVYLNYVLILDLITTIVYFIWHKICGPVLGADMESWRIRFNRQLQEMMDIAQVRFKA